MVSLKVNVTFRIAANRQYIGMISRFVIDEYVKQNKKPVVFCIESHLMLYPNKSVINVGKDSVEASHNLFKLYREVENKFDIIIAEYVENGNMVDGLFNRMSKSAGGKII